MREIGFAERPIRVRQFHVDAHPVGIDFLPGHLAESKENPTAIVEDGEDLDDLQKSLDDWESAGNFVLWWVKDYFELLKSAPEDSVFRPREFVLTILRADARGRFRLWRIGPKWEPVARGVFNFADIFIAPVHGPQIDPGDQHSQILRRQVLAAAILVHRLGDQLALR